MYGDRQPRIYWSRSEDREFRQQVADIGCGNQGERRDESNRGRIDRNVTFASRRRQAARIAAAIAFMRTGSGGVVIVAVIVAIFGMAVMRLAARVAIVAGMAHPSA